MLRNYASESRTVNAGFWLFIAIVGRNIPTEQLADDWTVNRTLAAAF